MTTWWTYAVAYLVACVGGWLIVGACMYGMRRWLGMNAQVFCPPSNSLLGAQNVQLH